MSNIYILSDELCDFCNVPHGSKMHIKHIVRKIEDYILNQIFIRDYVNNINTNYAMWDISYESMRTGNNIVHYKYRKFRQGDTSYYTYTDEVLGISNFLKYRYPYFKLDDKLKVLFKNIIEDEYVIWSVKTYCENNDANYENHKQFTHNFNDIDMYLEMSGHLIPELKEDIGNYLNKQADYIDTVKQEFTETINKVSNNIDTIKQEFTETINKVSTKLDNIKTIVSFSNDAENELIEVNKLLKELEEMYNTK